MFHFAETVLPIFITAILTLAGKIIYDRAFARRPKLLFRIQPISQFGTGSQLRKLQVLNVWNDGQEMVEDVRINFEKETLLTAEWSINFDGPYSQESVGSYASVVLKSLPPKDSATVYFSFPPNAPETGLGTLLVSVKGKNCLGRKVNTQTSVDEEVAFAKRATYLAAMALVLVAFTLLFYFKLANNNSSQKPLAEDRQAATPRQIRPTISLTLLSSDRNPRNINAEIIVVNPFSDPMVGYVRIDVPWEMNPDWTAIFQDAIVPRSASREIHLNLKIPKSIIAGHYQISAVFHGSSAAESITIEDSRIFDLQPEK
jgi:hypothetical protein